MAKDLEAATAELADWMNMVQERIPGIKPLLDKKRLELADLIKDTFKPWTDLADGKITEEQFDAIMAERQAEDLRQRHAKWDDVEVDGEWEVECTEDECERLDEPLIYEELPPMYPTHEDATGEPCTSDDADDEDDED